MLGCNCGDFVIYLYTQHTHTHKFHSTRSNNICILVKALQIGWKFDAQNISGRKTCSLLTCFHQKNAVTGTEFCKEKTNFLRYKDSEWITGYQIEVELAFGHKFTTKPTFPRKNTTHKESIIWFFLRNDKSKNFTIFFRMIKSIVSCHLLLWFFGHFNKPMVFFHLDNLDTSIRYLMRT